MASKAKKPQFVTEGAVSAASAVPTGTIDPKVIALLSSSLTNDEKENVKDWMSQHPAEAGLLLEDYKRAFLEACRQNVNTFIEYVGRDEQTNTPIVQAPIHESFQSLADKHPRLIIWAHIEAGKAVPLDTLIPTPDGWRTMGDLRVGDVVFGSDGKPCTVKWCSPIQHDRRVYEVVFDDGDSARADADHQWIAMSIDDAVAGRGWGTYTTDQMRERVMRAGGDGAQSKWRIPLAKPVDYPERKLLVHPYVLGAWLGDGDTAGTALTFHKDDAFVYERCVALYGYGTTPKADGRNPNVLRGSIGSCTDYKERHARGLRKDLRELGVLGNKHIPESYLLASIEQREELLAGLLDTDGSCPSKASGSSVIEYCSKLKHLAHGVLELVRSLGFKARIRVDASLLHGKMVGERWRVTFTARRPVFRLPRKLAKQKLIATNTRSNYRCVKAIIPIASVPVRCIAVDSADHSYLMNRSYTVTHNTQQLSILRSLWLLGNNPHLRIAVISRTAGQAQKIVKAIQGYIERSEELHEVFPRLKPGKKWTSTAFDVADARPTKKDWSFQALGIGSAVLGARLDLVILDDVLDWTNCRTHTQRVNVEEWYRTTVATRIAPEGKVLIVGNAWHPEDLLHTFARNPAWVAVTFPVVDPRTGEPRWPEKWPRKRIEAWQAEHPLEAPRMLFCVARSDSAARFKKEWIDACIARGEGRRLEYNLEHLPSGYKTYTGVDLGTSDKDNSDLTVLFTVCLHPNGDLEILCIESGRWVGPTIVEKIVETHTRYFSIVLVENNAAQAFIRQFVTKSTGVPVLPFTTGKNKVDPEFGVEALAVELHNKKWIIPSRGGIPASAEISAWINELLYYSADAHTGDRLMASWFAREGARTKKVKGGTGALDTHSR